jgi:hypothetical protein
MHPRPSTHPLTHTRIQPHIHATLHVYPCMNASHHVHPFIHLPSVIRAEWPNGEVLTPRGDRVHDTNDHNIPPTFASHDAWRFKNDTDDMSMLSTTYAMHPPVTAEVHSLSYVDCL